MYGVYTEVDIPDGTATEGAAAGLNANAVPSVRDAGAVAAYWMAPTEGRVRGMLLFPDEAAARAAAATIRVGDHPDPAPEGVVFRAVEVQPVIAHL